MAFRSSTGLAPGNGTTAAPAVPAGAAIGDIAVVGIYKESTAAITPPSGFTLKSTLNTSATARGSLYVYWKRLTAADTGTYSFSWSGAAWRGAVCGLWSGRIASGDPFDGTVGTAESTTGVTTLNVSTSPAAASGDAVGMWTNFNGGATWTPPASYTEQQDTNVMTLDSRDAVASGTTGSVTATATITDFMKAFLGVLAAAGGGTDATASPSAITTTVAAPQATPSAAATQTPAAAIATVAAPQATPSVSDAGAPAAISAVVTFPQATPSVAGNATATPATVTAVAAIPQASPTGSAVASPAVTVSTATLPRATPAVGGGATVTPASISALALTPQSTPSAGAAVSPARIQTAAGAPAATPSISKSATPSVISSVVAFFQALLHGGATASTQTVPIMASIPSANPTRIDISAPDDVAITVRPYASTAIPRSEVSTAAARDYESTATARSSE